MDRWEWTKIGAALCAAMGTALGADWLAAGLVRPAFPDDPSYKPPGAAEPVDLAVLQRSWPSGLGAADEQSRLTGLMGRIERGAVALPAATAVAAPSTPPADLGTLLAHASAANGKQTAHVCMNCHTFDRGGPNRIGPNLWGIVGRDIGSHPGFSYSQAVASAPGNWTYEKLDHYLTSPAREIPGNKMGFAGIWRAEDRANVIAFLATLNGTRIPFPSPKQETAKPLAAGKGAGR